MENFVVNENDPIHVMSCNLDKIILNIKKNKYNLILKFLNELFEKSHKSLKHFKIRVNFFKNENAESIDNMLEKYNSDFSKTLKFDICEFRKSKKQCKKTSKKKESDDNKSKYDVKLEIFEIIAKLLKVINYSIVINTIDDKKYYRILDVPPKRVRKNSNS